VSRDLAREYTRLLELVHLVVRTPAWSTNLSSRVSRQPKVHVTDPGLAAWLLGQSADRLASADPGAFTQTGHLLETFAATEILKGTGWADTSVAVSHYRTHDKVEVDLILETRDGRVAGIEVKAGPRLIDRDLSGLRHLRDRLGERFVRGVVLSPNPLPARVDDRIIALPIGAIWR
jgi:predicted AAA+ superfamily ATPase